ncbi:alpha-1,2-mannosidase [Streptomyces sp. NBC_01498]|uniref:alpha-1,2-mannosidase n=1 Tax=Streptomyces sp. NBC_01498 TaxID=2975870 RepID=UPI002E7AF9E4|nr:alpha-1,2-mannosidase [Streptomyces sp. NBC_01498]WTL24139.1 alpha-1,2-mannosidase [Streptomyces sp. NBC_01498]
MDPVRADFGVRPAVLSNALVRHHRCAIAPSYVVVAAGGFLKVDFAVPDGDAPAEAVLRVSVLGAAAPTDLTLNGEPLVKSFRLPAGEVAGAVREYAFTVPGAALRPGANVLEIRNTDEDDDGVLRLGTVTLGSADSDGRAGHRSGDRSGEGGGAGERSAWTFATERRSPGADAWRAGPDLVFHLDRSESRLGADGREPVSGLAWRETTGAEASLAFRSDMSGFHGHFRSADGSVGELRGTLAGQLPPAGSAGGVGGMRADVRHFTTEEAHDSVWAPAGRLRLALDSGGDPVERVTWSDRRGGTTSLSLLAAGPGPGPAAGEGRDITHRVSRVWASDEFTMFGEVADNLLRDGDKWLAHERTPDLHFTFDGPVTVTGYRLTSGNDCPDRDPSGWVLEGSSDGREWTRLDVREREVFPGRHRTEEFGLTEPSARSHYRLRITANGGADETQLSRVSFLDGGDTSPDPDACAFDFVGHRQDPGGEPVGYRGTRIPAPVSGAEETGDGEEEGRLLAGNFSDTARSLQDAARLLTQLTRYLRH